MLKRKHLSPWFLIYLILLLVQLLLIITAIVFIFLNELNGFNFTHTDVSTCKTSSVFKFNRYIFTILRICFIMSLVAGVFAIIQIIMVIILLIKFRSSANQNNQDEQLGQFSRSKLNALYVLSSIGLISLVPIFGNFFSFYIQFKQCSIIQNRSENYLIPFLLAGGALFFKIINMFVLLKIASNFNKQEKESSQTQDTQMQNKYFQRDQIMRKILQSSMPKNIQLFGTSKYMPSTPSSIDSPQQKNLHLLKKNMTAYDTERNPLNDNIYASDYNVFNNMNSNNQNYIENKYNNLSPNSLGSKQKQIMKNIPKYPYKKGKKRTVDYSDIIFQQAGSEQDSQYNQTLNQNVKQNNQRLKYSNATKQKSEISEQNKKIVKKFPQFPKHPYQNSIYLKNLQNKKISPSERRAIKIPFLQVDSTVIQFDSRNYQISEFTSEDQNISNNLSRKRSANKMQGQNNTGSISSANQQNIIRKGSNEMSLSRDNQKNLYSPKLRTRSNILNKNIDSSNNNSGTNPYKYSINKSKQRPIVLSPYMQEMKIKQDKQIQKQNPIFQYVQGDQSYEGQINKINQFDRLNRKKRNNIYPSYLEDNKESQTKLYLHKNKLGKNGFNKSNGAQLQDQQYGYDPFLEYAFEDEIYTQRPLVSNKEDSNNQNLNATNLSVKSNNKNTMKQTNLGSPKQIKKAFKKDGLLLDFIRSKYPY